MKNNFIHLLFKAALVLVVICSNLPISYAQSEVSNSVKIRGFYFETGGIYYQFRDQISSNLIYGGLGGGHIGLGYHTFKKEKLHHDINLFFEYGNAKYPKVPNEDYATIYRLSGIYSFYWQNVLLEDKLFWTYGSSITSDALYIIYPFLLGNNGDTYSMDFLSLGPNFGATYLFKKSKIDFFWNIDLIGWNARPQGYNGISPEKIFSESKITGITNNIRLSFKTSYTITFPKKNSLELSYLWQYRKNTSTINPLDYAQHGLNLRFYLSPYK